MKRLLLVPCLIWGVSAFGQTTDCGTLKKENTALKEKIIAYEARLGIDADGVKSMSPNEEFKIKFLSCKANKSTHEVLLKVLFTNLGEPDKFNIWTAVSKPGSNTPPSTIIDQQGQSFTPQNCRIGSQEVGYGSGGSMVPAKVPIQCSIELVDVPLSTTSFNSIILSFGSNIKGTNEFRNILMTLQNIPVTWIP